MAPPSSELEKPTNFDCAVQAQSTTSGNPQIRISRRDTLCRESGRILLQASFFTLGIGIVLPWNSFISAKSYFESRSCIVGHQHHNTRRNNLESTFAVVYNCGALLSLGLLLLTQWTWDQFRAAREASNVAQNQASDEWFLRSPSSTNAMSRSRRSASGHSFFLVMVPLTIYLVVCLGQAASVLWINVDPNTFYVGTLISLALCGCCGALATTGVVAAAGLFLPDIAMEPYQAGQSAGGLFVSLAILVAAAYEDPTDFFKLKCSNDLDSFTEANSTQYTGMETVPTDECSPYTRINAGVLAYFLLGSVVLATCIASYAYIENYQKDQHRDDYETVQDAETDNCAVADRIAFGDLDPMQSPHGVEMNSGGLLLQRRQESIVDSDGEQAVTSLRSTADLDLHATVHRGMVNTRMSFGHDPVMDDHHQCENETSEVWSVVRGPAISIFLVLLVTLALFPGWISQLRSIRQCSNVRNRWDNDLYIPIVFVVYNAGDLAGRLLAGYLPLSRMHNVSTKLVLASLLRFGFFPFLYICSSQYDRNSKWTIRSDLYSWLVQIFFAGSNGFLLTAAFVHAPSLLPNVTHVQERSAEILTFALYLGLLGGSWFSIPVFSMFAR